MEKFLRVLYKMPTKPVKCIVRDNVQITKGKGITKVRDLYSLSDFVREASRAVDFSLELSKYRDIRKIYSLFQNVYMEKGKTTIEEDLFEMKIWCDLGGTAYLVDNGVELCGYREPVAKLIDRVLELLKERNHPTTFRDYCKYLRWKYDSKKDISQLDIDILKEFSYYDEADTLEAYQSNLIKERKKIDDRHKRLEKYKLTLSEESMLTDIIEDIKKRKNCYDITLGSKPKVKCLFEENEVEVPAATKSWFRRHTFSVCFNPLGNGKMAIAVQSADGKVTKAVKTAVVSLVRNVVTTK